MSKKINKYSEYGETEESLLNWLHIIKKERIPLYNQIRTHIPPRSKAVEIGSGSSWLSLKLSQDENIEHITAIDIDFRRLDLAKNYFAQNLKGNNKKISFLKSDFHDLKLFKKDSLNIIFVDAALHHTETLDILLEELYRILEKKGKIIALREPILPSFPILQKIKKKSFGKKQIALGDIENTYTKEEWQSYFSNARFELTFYPVYSNSRKDKVLKRFFRWGNGLFFNRYFLVALKK